MEEHNDLYTLTIHQLSYLTNNDNGNKRKGLRGAQRECFARENEKTGNNAVRVNMMNSLGKPCLKHALKPGNCRASPPYLRCPPRVYRLMSD